MFRFKQFTIHQDRCAMKVCTDACLLGAWFVEKAPAFSRALDIGSGTGLLMLMLAQRDPIAPTTQTNLPAAIEGIELDPDAFGQLQENIAASPWHKRLKVFSGDARTYPFAGKYDFIISNPPFYESDLVSSSDTKNIARHSSALNLSELMTIIDAHLEDAGSFGILLPYHRSAYFIELAAGCGFYLNEAVRVRPTPLHDPFRSILHFSRKPDTTRETELIIRNEAGAYSNAFVKLLKDYYLYL